MNLWMSADARDKWSESQHSMGASIENQHLTAGLLKRLEETGKCGVVNQKVKSVKRATSSSELPQVELEDGTVVEPQLLVGSDGEKSLTRTEYGIGTWGLKYGVKGLVCTVKTIQPHQIAFQRFLKTGPVAVLPLWGSYSSIVWSLPDDFAEDLKKMDKSEFIDQLNNVLKTSSDAPMLGAVPDRVLPRSVKARNFESPPLITDVTTPRFTFPLNLSHADSLASHRMALIGDAAHRVHPLAG